MLFICLIVLLYQQLTLQLALVFSALPFMTRVRRSNARKDCLVRIVGVIAGGHYDQGRDLNAKLHDHFFVLNSFVSKDRLWPDCTSKWMLTVIFFYLQVPLHILITLSLGLTKFIHVSP